jgi:hypothetical protein
MSLFSDACGKKPIIGLRYKCNFCFNYDLCEDCYLNKAPTPPNYVSHKPSHTFTKLFGVEVTIADCDDPLNVRKETIFSSFVFV